MKHIILGLGLTISVPVLSLAACGEADELFDCTQICNRYDECVDEDSDVTACVDQCEDNADGENGEAFADQADECETCLDDRSCAESFPCTDECAGVIIASSAS
jgi:hypothetical protein